MAKDFMGGEIGEWKPPYEKAAPKPVEVPKSVSRASRISDVGGFSSGAARARRKPLVDAAAKTRTPTPTPARGRATVPAPRRASLPHEVFRPRPVSSSSAPSGPAPAGDVIGGATAGAAAGAAVGGPPGAVIGGGLGAVGGAVKAHGAKKVLRKAKLAKLGPGRQMLVAEFVICMVILALSPLTDKHADEEAAEFLKRGAATCAVFFVLGLIGSAGRGATKVAAGLGALITLSLLVSDRDVFAAVANKVGTSASSTEPAGLSAGNAIGDIGNNDITNEADIAGEASG